MFALTVKRVLYHYNLKSTRAGNLCSLIINNKVLKVQERGQKLCYNFTNLYRRPVEGLYGQCLLIVALINFSFD